VKHWDTWISNTTSITGVIFMYINVSPVILVVFDVHVYQCFTSYTCSVWYSCISMFHKHWDTWISNTTSITDETLRYMNIKHYKYNWWNIDIHEYQTLQA
jgi:hypothetical protein